jgi:hypothetical protein
MKKLLWILPFCLLVLASCNFPLSKTPSISASEISTRVAQTLQASANPENPTATPSLIPTTSLLTVTPTFTPTVTPTATTSPDDPRLTLGNPTFTGLFTKSSSFGLPYSDDSITMNITNGSMFMVSSKSRNFHWRLTYPTPRDFYLEGKFKTIACSGSDYYGLVMRSTNYDDGVGYYFGISCNGQYYLMRYNGTDPNIIIDWTTDPALLAGQNQENRIGVMLKEDQISLYINGKFIQKVSNDTIKEKGHFGVFQYPVDTSNMTIEVEEINEWDQP